MMQTDIKQQKKIQFSAILTPHRSLSPKGFLIFMGFICLVSFVAGFYFLRQGAWPVFGFFGLDVLLIYWAFKQNYRDSKLFETIELSRDKLEINRVFPSGRYQNWEFNPYWVRLGLDQHPVGSTQIYLTSRGKHLIFGAFLSDGERREFLAVLQQELLAVRGGINI